MNFKYLIKYHRAYFFGAILLLLVNLLAAYIPQLIKSAIDELPGLNHQAINHILISVLVLAVIMAIARIFSRQIIFGVGRQVEFDFKKLIFDHLLTLEVDFFSKQRTGDLMSIITNDVQSLRAFAGFAALNVLNTLIAFVIILPLMFELNFVITLIFVLTIPVVLFFIYVLSKGIKDYQEDVQIKLGELSNFLEENLSAIHIIKSYAQEKAEIQRFETYNNGLKQSYLKLIEFRSLMGPIMRVVASLGLIILLAWGGQAIIAETFTKGEFAAYSLYIYRLIWPISTLGWLITVVYRAQVSYKRIDDILAYPAKIANHPEAVIKKNFDEQLVIADEVVPKGSNIVIVGTVASGKSTLAYKLTHLKELTPGEILLDGVDLQKIDLGSLRKLINLVPQESFLFPISIAENIAYARELTKSEIMELAKVVSIYDEIVQLPEAFESVVGERGVTLSGGQRQRITIARALAINPEILVLDDALSNLDTVTGEQILTNITKYRQGKTTIFITHKLQFAKAADQIWVMDKGKIVEVGSHVALMAQENSLYAALWRSVNDRS